MDEHRPAPPAEALTEREQEIVRLLAHGLSDGEIAEATILTVGTVKWYNRQIYGKLGARNRTEAVNLARELGLLGHTVSAPAVRPPAQNNLPTWITSFVGREHELDELQQLVRHSRLVTLTGPPGTGKTRLALAAAGSLLTSGFQGVYFVPLAPVQEARHVLNAIAATLNVYEPGSTSTMAALIQRLHNQQTLLVVDNFEHVLDAAPVISDLLAAAPRLTVMVTSREALRLYGEHEFPVPPLSLPDLRQPSTASSIRHHEAVELFVERAHAASPDFALDDQNAAAVAAICVHLDGLPLAIELAAVRIKFYAPESLLVRLGSRLEALGDGPRDLPARQRTLRATLAWSFDLLEPDEQILFARLGVFAGGCTLEAAYAVCSADLDLDIAHGLESLFNKSLILRQQREAGERFAMLETMREYALEKLEEHGEAAVIRERHTGYYLSLTGQAVEAYYGPQELHWVLQLEAEHDNIRSALQWGLTNDPNGNTSLRLIVSMARFWEIKGYYSEGRGWLTEALRLPGAGQHTRLRADALHGAADIAYMQGDYGAARLLFDEATSLYDELGEQLPKAHALIGKGEVFTEIGDYNTAFELFKQSLAIMRELEDRRGVARALYQLGYAAVRVGDLDQAWVWFNQALPYLEEIDEQIGIAGVLAGLGEVAVRRRQLDEASVLLERSLSYRRMIGQPWGIAVVLGTLAWAAILRGELDRAAAQLHESMLIRVEINERGGIAWCLEKLAEIARLREDYGRAARILGGAAAYRASFNSIVDPADQ